MAIKLLSKKMIIFASVFAAFFLASLVFIMFDADRRVERVLFFPDKDGLKVYGELRRLPVRPDLEGNVELYIDEMLLGPEGIDLYRLFPESTALESLLLKGGTLYLGYSENLVTTAETVPMGFLDIIEAAEAAVVFNFPEIKEVKTAVGGEPVELDAGIVEKK